MKHIESWPNKLGFDIGASEIWIHKDGFRVFTETRVMRVPYTVTRNPETALAICESHGLDRATLDDIEPYQAQAIYFAHVPSQIELY